MTQATAAGVASSNAFGPADPADLFHGYGHDGNVIRIDDDRLPDREGYAEIDPVTGEHRSAG